MDLTPEQRKLALECWKNNVCETGHGNLTVAYADGFGENVWRQVTKMEFILQALTYPDIKKIIYTSATGDATKAVSDMRAFIAQKVDVIVIFADAGPALLPTVKEATEAGILVVLHNGTYVGGKAGKDFVTSIAEDLCALGTEFVKKVGENSTKDPTTIVELGGTPGNGLSAGWQKCAEQEIAKHKNDEAARQGRHQLDAGRIVQGDVGLPRAARQRRRGAVRICRRLPRRSARL